MGVAELRNKSGQVERLLNPLRHAGDRAIGADALPMIRAKLSINRVATLAKSR